jgi:transmembrane sensor
MQKNYTSYLADDFLEDDRFIAWVAKRKPEDEGFWEAWIAAGPPNLQEMERARLQLEVIFSLERIPHQPEKVQQLWSRLEYNIDAATAVQQGLGRRRWMAAASLTLLITLGGLLFYYSWYKGQVMVQTSKGERRALLLPDSTQITLNENSTLRYPRYWNSNAVRRVQLTGEAFFEVKHLNRDTRHIQNKERFIVNTSDLFIEVLGTRFNVRNRNNQTRVALVSGRILVGRKLEEGRPLQLQPGEVIQYDPASGSLQKQQTDPALQYAWKDRMITLHNTTVNDIIATTEDIFDCRIILDDPLMGKRKIDGAIPLRSDTNVVFILSNILHANISRDGNAWILKTKQGSSAK